jgi:hypothetical protein
MMLSSPRRVYNNLHFENHSNRLKKSQYGPSELVEEDEETQPSDSLSMPKKDIIGA